MTINEPAHVTIPSASVPLPQDITDALCSVERLMFEIVHSDVTVLRETSRHILGAGGKRIRPRLLLLGYAAVAGSAEIQKAVPVAAAIELVHTASVVHDDINDHGVMRRGRPSVNALWGRTLALLTGDYLFTKVYELMAPFAELNGLFAEATIALVEGETLQAVAAKENNLSREVYWDIISRKTAALFRVAAMMGARLGGAEVDGVVEALGQYGYNIGLAFQIVDDILDIIGDETELGKTVGLDLTQGKGISAVGDNGREPGDVIEMVKRKVMEGNTLSEAQNEAQQLVQMAVIALDALPTSPYKDALIGLARAVVERNS